MPTRPLAPILPKDSPGAMPTQGTLPFALCFLPCSPPTFYLTRHHQFFPLDLSPVWSPVSSPVTESQLDHCGPLQSHRISVSSPHT